MKNYNGFKLVTINQNFELSLNYSGIIEPAHKMIYNKLHIWNDIAEYYKNEIINRILLYILTNKLMEI